MVDPSVHDLVTDLRSPDLGKPKYYKVYVDAPICSRETIHHSRVIRFEGKNLPYLQKLAENLWGLSVLEPIWDRILAFDSTTAGTAQLVYRAHVRTLSIESLREIIASGGKMLEAMLEQVDMMRRFQNNEGITLLDAKDKFEAMQYSFTGLDAVLIQMGQQLSGAMDIPLVRLFGQSPLGLNSTGESDFRNYYDAIASRQNKDLRPGLTKLLQVVGRSDGIVIPEDFTYQFTSLWQLSDQEKVNTAATATNAIVTTYVDQIIDKPTALRELKSVSKNTGMWSNITDKMIEEAEQEPPPFPEFPELEEQSFLPGTGSPKIEKEPSPLNGELDSKIEFLPGKRRLKKRVNGLMASELEASEGRIHKPIHLHLADDSAE
jgi:phage-related protein (TIGR01555 family)